MTQTELNIYQSTLTSKHTELVRAQGKRDGIAIVRTPDALDEVQFASERELSTRTLERGSTLLRDVRGKATSERDDDSARGLEISCADRSIYSGRGVEPRIESV